MWQKIWYVEEASLINWHDYVGSLRNLTKTWQSKTMFQKRNSNVEESGLIDGHDDVGSLRNSTNTYTWKHLVKKPI